MSVAGSSTVSVCGLNERSTGHMLILTPLSNYSIVFVLVWLFPVLKFCNSFNSLSSHSTFNCLSAAVNLSSK